MTPNLGGSPHSKLVSVSTSPTLLTDTPTNGQVRSNLVIQQAGNVDVYLGGPEVAATGPNQGYLLKANPDDPTSDFPAELWDFYASQSWYAIVASGSGSVHVLELY
jgi:hypothetical protein